MISTSESSPDIDRSVLTSSSKESSVTDALEVVLISSISRTCVFRLSRTCVAGVVSRISGSLVFSKSFSFSLSSKGSISSNDMGAKLFSGGKSTIEFMTTLSLLFSLFCSCPVWT